MPMKMPSDESIKPARLEPSEPKDIPVEVLEMIVASSPRGLREIERVQLIIQVCTYKLKL
jgi:hypothetical protein